MLTELIYCYNWLVFGCQWFTASCHWQAGHCCNWLVFGYQWFMASCHWQARPACHSGLVESLMVFSNLVTATPDAMVDAPLQSFVLRHNAKVTDSRC